MALPASGAISMNDVNTELGNPGTTQISLNDTDVRTLFNIPSGAISLSDGYGCSSFTGATLGIIAVTPSAMDYFYFPFFGSQPTVNSVSGCAYCFDTSTWSASGTIPQCGTNRFPAFASGEVAYYEHCGPRGITDGYPCRQDNTTPGVPAQIERTPFWGARLKYCFPTQTYSVGATSYLCTMLPGPIGCQPVVPATYYPKMTINGCNNKGGFSSTTAGYIRWERSGTSVSTFPGAPQFSNQRCGWEFLFANAPDLTTATNCSSGFVGYCKWCQHTRGLCTVGSTWKIPFSTETTSYIGYDTKMSPGPISSSATRFAEATSQTYNNCCNLYSHYSIYYMPTSFVKPFVPEASDKCLSIFSMDTDTYSAATMPVPMATAYSPVAPIYFCNSPPANNACGPNGCVLGFNTYGNSGTAANMNKGYTWGMNSASFFRSPPNLNPPQIPVFCNIFNTCASALTFSTRTYSVISSCLGHTVPGVFGFGGFQQSVNTYKTIAHTEGQKDWCYSTETFGNALAGYSAVGFCANGGESNHNHG